MGDYNVYDQVLVYSISQLNWVQGIVTAIYRDGDCDVQYLHSGGLKRVPKAEQGTVMRRVLRGGPQRWVQAYKVAKLLPHAYGVITNTHKKSIGIRCLRKHSSAVWNHVTKGAKDGLSLTTKWKVVNIQSSLATKQKVASILKEDIQWPDCEVLAVNYDRKAHKNIAIIRAPQPPSKHEYDVDGIVWQVEQLQQSEAPEPPVITTAAEQGPTRRVDGRRKATPTLIPAKIGAPRAISPAPPISSGCYHLPIQTRREGEAAIDIDMDKKDNISHGAQTPRAGAMAASLSSPVTATPDSLSTSSTSGSGEGGERLHQLEEGFKALQAQVAGNEEKVVNIATRLEEQQVTITKVTEDVEASKDKLDA